MTIKRVEFGVMPMTRSTYPYTAGNGRYCFYDDHIKIVDQQLAEIASLKAELAMLMSSLESWDEEFK